MAEELALLAHYHYVIRAPDRDALRDAAPPATLQNTPPQAAPLVCAPCRPRRAATRQERKAAKASIRKLRGDAGAGDALRRAGMCAHWMASKSRYCNFAPPEGLRYCRHHDPDLAGDLARVPCPVDGSHTVLRSQLEAHVKICATKTDADRQRQQAWFREGVNGGGAGALGDVDAPPRPTRALLAALGAFEAQRCGARPSAAATKRQRHAIQGDLIVEAAAREIPDLFADRAAVVDLGAGKGGLAARVRAAYPGDAVVCVEREARRHKRDGDMREVGAFARVRGDLADVDLAKVDALGTLAVVGVAKHLCGSASDLALKALDSLPAGTWRGLALATCCHHRCDWSSYVGRDYFCVAVDGGNAAEFAKVARWAAWATIEDPDAAPAARDRSGHDRPPASDPDEALAGLGWREKRDVGRRCKQLIDEGRIDFLARRGLARAARVHYCDAALSPENNLIVADGSAAPVRAEPVEDDVKDVAERSWCHCACS